MPCAPSATGGVSSLISGPFIPIRAEIEASAFRFQHEVEAGERVVVGVNAFASDAHEKVELLQVDPAGEQRQRERTAQVRATRDDAAAAEALDEVRRDASSDANLLPAVRGALHANSTVGEICGVLRELWGTHDAHA